MMNLVRQWKEVSKGEEEITVKRSEGRRLQVEKVQNECTRTGGRTDNVASKKERRKTAGWSTRILEEVASRQEHEGTEKRGSREISVRRV